MIKSIEGRDHFVIDDTNWKQFMSPVVNGEKKATGCDYRDPDKYPVGCYSKLVTFESLDMDLIPESEYDARYDEMVATNSFLSSLRRTCGPNYGPIPSLDQNGQGFCWMYDPVMAIMLLRAIGNMPYKRLSAHGPACLVKNYADQGGWSPLAMEHLIVNGVADVDHWKEKSMSRSNDTPEMRANALLHRPTEVWADLGTAVYNRNLTDQQAMTCLFNRIPVCGDFNWWGHSVCLMDPVRIEKGHWGKKGINSWTDAFGDMGEFTLTGSKAILDGGVSPRVAILSLASAFSPEKMRQSIA